MQHADKNKTTCMWKYIEDRLVKQKLHLVVFMVVDFAFVWVFNLSFAT